MFQILGAHPWVAVVLDSVDLDDVTFLLKPFSGFNYTEKTFTLYCGLYHPTRIWPLD